MRKKEQRSFACQALVGCLGVSLAACAAETTLLVTIDGDFSVPVDIDALDVRVESGDEVAFREVFVLSADAALPESVLFEPGPHAEDLLQVTVRGLLGGARGVERGWGQASGQFRSGEQVRVAVQLRRSCADGCEGDDVCYLGECGRPPCDVPEDCDDQLFCTGVETCEDGFCVPGTAPDCADGYLCTRDSCDPGSDQCRSEPDNSLCIIPEMGVCNPSVPGSEAAGGCIPG